MRPEELAQLSEDTRHEQFFFDAPTTRRLLRLAGAYRDPLMVCMPTLAVHLAAQGRRVTLLDRDRRFRGLAGHQRWDLQKPHMVFGDHDALFVDPPFANITLDELARAVDLLAGGMPARPDVYICHLREREAGLCARFAADGLQRLGPPLGYRSVAADTQARIHLFGPAAPRHGG